MLHGRCHCGAIHYEMPDVVLDHSLCHCDDCKRQSGAPVVAWAKVALQSVTITGEPQVYHSSEHGRRMFCGRCGTNLFYTNAVMIPGEMDVLSATLVEPERIPVTVQYQVAERISWMKNIDDLPAHERWPGM